MVVWIEKMFKHSFEHKWFETYWAIDLHGVVFIPTFRKDDGKAVFYPFAKETLQLMSNRKDIVLIMFTSSYPSEIESYNKVFVENDITFQYINENPEIQSGQDGYGSYDKKFYYNVLFEDKAGFDPLIEWKQIYDLLIKYEREIYLPDPSW